MLASEVISERFRLDSEVASGGMGTVYRGHDLQTQSPVAIKVLQLKSGTEAERFSREAALLAQVSHPGIVRYLAHGTTTDGQYLVMEWIDGETLKDRLSRQGLTIVESVETARKVAEALSEMHGRGIIHRDIKPSNLMFPGGMVAAVKILDFGIARRSDDLIRLTRTGFMVGSPGYMAPEQARGDREALDHRADLFALGCVLYECLTGRPPFFGDPVSVRAKVLLADPSAVRELNEDVSRELDLLVAQLLSKERGNRPLDAAELAAQLSALRELPGVPRKQESGSSTTAVTAALRPPKRPLSPPQPRLTFLVFAGESAKSAPVPQRVNVELASIVSNFGGRLEDLDGRWWMILFSGAGAPRDEAASAARCALRIRGLFPGAPIALLAEKSTARLDALIDRAVTTVTSESLASIFSEALPGSQDTEGIRLDEATAALLDADFEVTRTATGMYLQREGGDTSAQN